MEQLPPSGWDQVATEDEVTTGFAGLHLVLAKHIRWIAAMLLGFAVSMAVPLTIALL